MAERNGVAGLSSREQEVLELAATGRTDKGIALKLGISEGTVATYWLRIRHKLNTNGRAESIAVATQAAADAALQEARDEHDALQAEVEAHAREEAKYRGLLDVAPDAILIVDKDHKIAEFNAEAERLFGRVREETIGLPITDLIPERFRLRHKQHQAAYIRRPARRPMGTGMGLVALRGDGSELPVEISLSPLETENGPVVMAVVHPSDDRVAEIAELRRRIVKMECELQRAREKAESPRRPRERTRR
ncbi:MAG TPA: PAS domain S-box protein [Fimbriimonadaceae bacterium]|nr:PAS domain S-box protein [Fimbriimonadaceae bacterium]HRJ97764.1 PAS domain S-box protein [Fimbriimonadaceae bacterium]